MGNTAQAWPPAQNRENGADTSKSASHFESLLAQATSTSRRSSDASRRGSDVSLSGFVDEVAATPDCFGPTPDIRHQSAGFAGQGGYKGTFAKLLDQAAADEARVDVSAASAASMASVASATSYTEMM